MYSSAALSEGQDKKIVCDSLNDTAVGCCIEGSEPVLLNRSYMPWLQEHNAIANIANKIFLTTLSAAP